MSPDRVVFLDFDGVLNTPSTWGLFPRAEAIDAVRVARIERLCAETGAQVVISSSWRTSHDLDDLRAMLTSKGLAAGRVIGTTTSLLDGTRAREIKAWLDASLRDDTVFVILDDERADLDGLWRHLVQTNFEHGVTDLDIEEAIDVLTGAA